MFGCGRGRSLVGHRSSSVIVGRWSSLVIVVIGRRHRWSSLLLVVVVVGRHRLSLLLLLLVVGCRHRLSSLLSLSSVIVVAE